MAAIAQPKMIYAVPHVNVITPESIKFARMLVMVTNMEPGCIDLHTPTPEFNITIACYESIAAIDPTKTFTYRINGGSILTLENAIATLIEMISQHNALLIAQDHANAS